VSAGGLASGRSRDRKNSERKCQEAAFEYEPKPPKSPDATGSGANYQPKPRWGMSDALQPEHRRSAQRTCFEFLFQL
jgi:hypothetical protein